MDGELRRFLHDLHFATDKTKPPAWQPDWKDAPRPFKLYKNLPAIFPLSSEVPFMLPAIAASENMQPDLRSFGHFLWYTYGVTQVSRGMMTQVGDPSEPIPPGEWYRRAVPSGGGLYPNEIYTYLKLPELPAGIYHYDAAHHQLILLREGYFDDYLERALGGRVRLADAFGVLLVSVYFWKNFYKYFYFSYRLQGLDTGVLLGQLQEAAVSFGYTPHVFGQFLDRAVNHLLGLTSETESVYAVVPLSAGFSGSILARQPAAVTSAEQLIRELPLLTHTHDIRSRNVLQYPLLMRMHHASMQEETTSFQHDHDAMISDLDSFPDIPLPPVKAKNIDLAAATLKRYSPETDFVLKPISLSDLARMLQSASAGTGFCDLDTSTKRGYSRRSQLICGTFFGVEGLENGAYLYNEEAHALKLLRSGDHRAWLQYGMLMHNVNLFQVPMCFHIAGDRRHGINSWGARGYRLQQMEAGMRTQRLLLAAASEGWGGRPLLGYDTETIDDLYRLAARYDTALIQVPVGPYRYRARWESRMHG